MTLASTCRLELAAAALLLLILAGCSRVAPYQRGRLAHPTMAPGDGSSLARAHMHSVHEGATGSLGRSSSGCGCN